MVIQQMTFTAHTRAAKMRSPTTAKVTTSHHKKLPTLISRGIVAFFHSLCSIYDSSSCTCSLGPLRYNQSIYCTTSQTHKMHCSVFPVSTTDRLQVQYVQCSTSRCTCTSSQLLFFLPTDSFLLLPCSNPLLSYDLCYMDLVLPMGGLFFRGIYHLLLQL